MIRAVERGQPPKGIECGICHNGVNNRSHVVREMMFGTRKPFQYMECGRCGCMQLAQHPLSMSEFYPDNYYSFSQSPNSNLGSRWKQWRAGLRKRYAATGRGYVGRLLNRKRPRTSLDSLRPMRLKTHSRIMDVGCGAGRLLDDLYQAGFRSLYGIDPYNSSDILRPNGIRIDRATIFTVDYRADAIMFHHSFEHLDNPLQTLQRCHDLLRPGGWCLLRLPVTGCYAWQHYGTDWVQIDAPRHYFLHTIKSIELLGADSGFRLEQVDFDSTEFQFWGSEQYRQGIALRDERSYAENPQQGPFSHEEIQEYRQRAIELNRAGSGDQAAFYLSRLP